jgi:hypothetical protein
MFWDCIHIAWERYIRSPHMGVPGGRAGGGGGGGGGQTRPVGQYSLHSRVNGSRTLGSLKVFYKKYMRNSDSLNIAHF